MDLSEYYKEFQTTYVLGIVVVLFGFFVVSFIGIRTIRDKKEKVIEKIINCTMLIIILALVLSMFFRGPFLYKKDIDQKTIYYYEGDFDILSTSHGKYNKATFSIENENITIKYFEDENYDFDSITPGSYEGKLVYAQNSAIVLYIEIYQSE